MEIPGYRILRELGSGGSARVYLALQHAFGKQVAIKVLAQDAAQDATARERFLHEGEIAKRLDHPNIVRVLDVGHHLDTCYLVMEYLRGGDLNRNLASGLHMQNVLMVVKEIAAALDYAHGKGIAHGDVKPENILFNAQGTALLADFGVASRLGESAVDQHGLARGTRPYMSPEQAAGRALDERSDIYSLGVVLYHMLTGALPFDRASPRATGAGVPSLPAPLASFNGVMRKLLAQSPEQRFQSGAELIAELDGVRSAGLVPNAVVKTEPIATAEIDVAVNARRRRIGRTAMPIHRSRRQALAVLGILAVVAIAAGAVYFAVKPSGLERILAYAGLIEDPEVASAWQEAQALGSDPNQSLRVVVAAYRRVLASDNTHAGATVGIEMASQRWKQDAAAALDAGDYGTAEAKLNDLVAIFPADADLAPLFDRLGDIRQAQGLLADMRRLLAHAGLSHIASADAAIVTYKEVLRLMPDNGEALAALDEIAIHYGDLAQRDARAQDVAAAMANFQRAVAANQTFDGVQAVRATISEAEALQAEIDAMLQQAAELREAGALIDPPGASAAEIYRRVLATKPDDVIALQGLSEVSAQVLANFRELLDVGRLEDANASLDRALASGIAEVPIAEMQASYEAELDRIAAVGRLIAEAEELYAQGYVTGPSPDDNVVARLREALRLDADNADARRLLSVAATRLAQVAEDAHHAGMVEEGLLYLDLALTVTPGISRWRELRETRQAELARERGQ